MIRAALYARYSTDKQREASIEDQARNCRRIVEREGWQLGKIYQDQAMSGSRVDRTSYLAMLADAKDRKVHRAVKNLMTRSIWTTLRRKLTAV